MDASLIEKVRQWGRDRNLTDPENMRSQTLKLVEEFGELQHGLLHWHAPEIKDGGGDTFVVAILLSVQLGLELKPEHFKPDTAYVISQLRAGSCLGVFCSNVVKNQLDDAKKTLLDFIAAVSQTLVANHVEPADALQSAYNVIKDRKGVMYKGAFIKEADPAYPKAYHAVHGKYPEGYDAGADRKFLGQPQV